MDCRSESKNDIYIYLRDDDSKTSFPQLPIMKSNFKPYLMNIFKAVRNTSSETNFNMVLLSNAKKATIMS